MKKTLDVNISGYIYHIDQDAYDKLLSYFNKLEKHYGDNEEAKEIVRDIEQRFSELLNEKKTNDNMVFSMGDIEELISILGTPEDLFEEETETTNEYKYKATKKLYRDNDKRIIGGVASGISAYLGLPVILVRTLWVILILMGYGFPSLIYIVMWIAVPKAITPSQKLEMKGEAINVDNIEKTIKKEYQDVKSNMEKNSPKLKSFLSNLGDTLNDIFNALGKVLRIIIGAFLAGLGLIVIISFMSSMFLASTFIFDLELVNVIPGIIMNSANLTLFSICLGLVVCIPFFLISYLGIKLIFQFKSHRKIVGFTCLALWIFALVNLAIISASQFKNYKEKADTYTIATNLDSSSEDIVYLQSRNNVIEHSDDAIQLNNIYLSAKNDYTLLYGKPEIKIEKSETSNYEIIIKKEAKSRTKKDAFKAAENISYKWNLQDSVIHIDRFFKIDNDIKWRNQKVTIYIKIPVGKKIAIDEYTYEYANIDNENFYHFYKNFRSLSSWKMDENGELRNTNENIIEE